jgi:hypothetical protein
VGACHEHRARNRRRLQDHPAAPQDRTPKRRCDHPVRTRAESLLQGDPSIPVSRSDLEKPPSARGWGYLLEGANAITKGDIDLVENLINDCRKSGSLPLDICVVDISRAFSNVEQIDSTTPEEEAHWAVDYIKRA